MISQSFTFSRLPCMSSSCMMYFFVFLYYFYDVTFKTQYHHFCVKALLNPDQLIFHKYNPLLKPASVAQWANTLSRSAVGLVG